jgi:hypothetical protein
MLLLFGTQRKDAGFLIDCTEFPNVLVPDMKLPRSTLTPLVFVVPGLEHRLLSLRLQLPVLCRALFHVSAPDDDHDALMLVTSLFEIYGVVCNILLDGLSNLSVTKVLGTWSR